MAKREDGGVVIALGHGAAVVRFRASERDRAPLTLRGLGARAPGPPRSWRR